MPIDVLMPQLSDEMAEGTVSRWLVQIGETVAVGDPLAEVETEKVIVEVEATQDGVLVEIIAQEQEVVPVGGLLCRIGSAGEAVATGEPVAARLSGGEERSPPEPVPTPAPAQVASAAPAAATPLAAEVSPSNVVPLVQPGTAEAGGGVGNGGEAVATPLARRIARELGIDLSQVAGSGIGGKIVKTDLQAFLPAPSGGNTAAFGGSAAALSAGGQVLPVGRAEPLPESGGAFEDIAHSPMRRTVARRMAAAKGEIPHFYMTAETDVTELLRVRRDLNDRISNQKVSVNDLMIKAVALTLQRVPEYNAAYLETAVRRFEEIHVGFAVAIEGGLLTPVVRDCHLKSVGRIAEDTAGLVERAKTRRLQPRDLEGGTFTISNMGMYDIVEFSAIINPPQVGILAIARPVEKPVVVDGRVVVRSRLNVTLSSDHRAIDGVNAAGFLMAFKEIVENPVNFML